MDENNKIKISFVLRIIVSHHVNLYAKVLICYDINKKTRTAVMRIFIFLLYNFLGSFC